MRKIPDLAIYGNPIYWVVGPIFSLGVYLERFNNAEKGNSRLFPGQNQFKRFFILFKTASSIQGRTVV